VSAEPAHPAPHDWSDLRSRIASGVILGAIAVAAALAGGPWIAGAAGAAVVAMSYEWSRMSEPGSKYSAFIFALAGALGAVFFASRAAADLGLAWLLVCALFSALRRHTIIGKLETALGLIYVGAPCALFLWFRAQPFGLEFVLSLFAIIWSADVAAYFGGKLIGGPRIAEGLSPNKTWSGIAAGTFAGAVAGLTCGQWLADQAWSSLWLAGGMGIAFVGLMGDLFESFLKRRFGVKDASRLIPGHGGVLDRIDGLMMATLVLGAVLGLEPSAARGFFGVAP
jgi:phosphatidate cytidylyltransferase